MTLTQCDWHPSLCGENIWTQTCLERRPREIQGEVCQPRKEASVGTAPADTWVRLHETMHRLSRSACGMRDGSSSTLTQQPGAMTETNEKRNGISIQLFHHQTISNTHVGNMPHSSRAFASV